MRRLAASVLLAIACTVTPAFAQLTRQAVVTGLENPLSFAQDPSQPNVQLVIEKAGRIRVIESGVLRDEPYLDLTSKVLTTGENGVLGLAFAPNYASSRRVFVYYINTSGHTVVARFLRRADDPLRADPDSEFDLVWSDGNPVIPQEAEDAHKGGHLAFGPDGMLYIGLGDGGGGTIPNTSRRIRPCWSGRCCASTSTSETTTRKGSTSRPTIRSSAERAAGDLGIRAAQPVALVVRQSGARRDGRAHHRRRRARRVGRDQLRAGRPGRTQLRLAQSRRRPRLHHGAAAVLRTAHRSGTGGTRTATARRRRSITGGFVYRGSALGAGYVGRYFFADFVLGHAYGPYASPSMPAARLTPTTCRTTRASSARLVTPS